MTGNSPTTGLKRSPRLRCNGERTRSAEPHAKYQDGETIGVRLTATKGGTTGSGHLRAGLSISVIAFHSVITSCGLRDAALG